MTPPTPAPDPGREGTPVATVAAGAPRTGPLPALPGIDSEAAVRAAGAAARSPRRPARSGPPRPGPGTHGPTALAAVPSPADGRRPGPARVPDPEDRPHTGPATLGGAPPGAVDEEALVEAGIAELWAAYAEDP